MLVRWREDIAGHGLLTEAHTRRSGSARLSRPPQRECKPCCAMSELRLSRARVGASWEAAYKPRSACAKGTSHMHRCHQGLAKPPNAAGATPRAAPCSPATGAATSHSALAKEQRKAFRWTSSVRNSASCDSNRSDTTFVSSWGAFLRAKLAKHEAAAFRTSGGGEERAGE